MSRARRNHLPTTGLQPPRLSESFTAFPCQGKLTGQTRDPNTGKYTLTFDCPFRTEGFCPNEEGMPRTVNGQIVGARSAREFNQGVDASAEENLDNVEGNCYFSQRGMRQ